MGCNKLFTDNDQHASALTENFSAIGRLNELGFESEKSEK